MCACKVLQPKQSAVRRVTHTTLLTAIACGFFPSGLEGIPSSRSSPNSRSYGLRSNFNQQHTRLRHTHTPAVCARWCAALVLCISQSAKPWRGSRPREALLSLSGNFGLRSYTSTSTSLRHTLMVCVLLAWCLYHIYQSHSAKPWKGSRPREALPSGNFGLRSNQHKPSSSSSSPSISQLNEVETLPQMRGVNSIAWGRSYSGSQYGLCSTAYSSPAHMKVVCIRFSAANPVVARVSRVMIRPEVTNRDTIVIPMPRGKGTITGRAYVREDN